MKKRIIELICICSVLLMTGCSAFVEGFKEGIEKANNPSGIGISISPFNEQPHTDKNEIKTFMEQRISENYLEARMVRFSAYEYETGIPMYKFEKRSKLVDLFEKVASTSPDNTISNLYFLGYEKNGLLGQEKTFIAAKPFDDITFYPLAYYDNTPVSFYIGDINSNNQPHGYGAILFAGLNGHLYGTDESMFAISYAGEFKNGKKDGYGIQFYLPDAFYQDDVAHSMAADTVSNNGKTYSNENEYQKDLSETYKTYFSIYLNCPVYEGEFKENAFSGKGNFSSPYVCNLNEYDYNISENFRILDCEIMKKFYLEKDFVMIKQLYVGTFKEGKPDRAKCYENGMLFHDGQWEGFDEPK